MTIKDLHIPVRVIKDFVLLRRLPNHYIKKREVEEDFAKRKAGFRGEQNLQYQLSFLPNSDYQIFFDLRLSIENHIFQIDTLLLSTNYALIIEVKNFKGTVIFDSQYGQFIRIHNSKEERYHNPLLQVMRHENLLNDWLKNHRMPFLPIEHLVVMSNPSTIIKASSDDIRIAQKVIHAEQIVHKIKDLELIHNKKMTMNSEITKLTSILLENHAHPDIDILDIYKIPYGDITKGVQCPNCHSFRVDRLYGAWYCSICKTKSKKAHEQGVLDYFLLFGPTMTSQQCRQFILFNNRKTMHYLLSNMDLSFSNGGRNRIYHSPDNVCLHALYRNVILT